MALWVWSRAQMAFHGLFLALCLSSMLLLAATECTWDPAGDSSSCSSQCAPWSGEFFPDVPSSVPYEGPSSTNPLAYRFYNASEVIRGKTMSDWLRFSVAFWHSFRGDGSDPFGSPTRRWPWDDPSCSEMELARRRMHALFEFLRKLGVRFWCFHDRDIAPEGPTLAQTNANLDAIADLAAELQAQSGGVVPLWGTAQLFKHPRYQHGAATSPEVRVFAFAVAQVKKAMEVTARLGGQGFVFWGGREGYSSLLNTDMGREGRQLAAFLRMAAQWRQRLGFEGPLLLEPKPHEPSKHQYDWDAATSLAFLLRHNLTVLEAGAGGGPPRLAPFALNIECNHATLSRHSCEHELEVARLAGGLRSIDANTGDEQLGWDTDQFLTDPAAATRVMLAVLRNGGLEPGGINFDAKLRRESTDPTDLAIAHIQGMDALARGLRSAVAILDAGQLEGLLAQRYSSWDSALGRRIEGGEVGFEDLEAEVLGEGGGQEPRVGSGRQELAEAYFLMHV